MNPRKRLIIILSAAIVVILIAIVILWFTNNKFIRSIFNRSIGVVNVQVTASPAPSATLQFPSKLDGTKTSLALSERHPLGVMVENHTDARPQAGLSGASFIYEAIAEGGITRFLAIYGPGDATKVGPIRSARTYFADWCNEYDCFYAHIGGNYDALYEKIPADKIKDLDQFANSGSYYRDNSRKVASEHTLYSSTSKLYELANSKKWSTPIRNDYNIFNFFENPTAPITPTISKISIDFSTPNYKVDYLYNATKNNYQRSLASKPHLDANNNQQLTAQNIIIQYINRSPVVTAINESGWAMPTVGKGKAEIYQGGKKIVGTWSKTSKYSRTQFMDENGTLIKLYSGPTWIEVVNPGILVTSS